MTTSTPSTNGKHQAAPVASPFDGRRILGYQRPMDQWLFHPALREGQFRQWDVPAMMRDTAVSIGLLTIYGPILGAQFEVRTNSKSKDIKTFVENTIYRFWHHDLIKVLRHYVPRGTCPGEVIYEKDIDTGLWKYAGLDDFDMLDVQAVRRGRHLTKVRVANSGSLIGGISMPSHDPETDPGLPEWNTLEHPKIFWAAHGALCGNPFGKSALEGAWGPWMEKCGSHGAVSNRRLWAFSNSFRGCLVKYPPGQTQRADGTMAQNQDIARELAEGYCTGAALICPSGNDDQGKPLWEIIDPRLNGEIKGLMEYPSDLNRDIWMGMGVLDEVLSAPDTGGSWSGRSGPLLIFLNIEDMRVSELITAFDVGPSGYTTRNEQAGGVIRSLVMENFGPNARYQIIPISLVPKPAEPGAGGTGGAPPPGSPAAGPPTPAAGPMGPPPAMGNSVKLSGAGSAVVASVELPDEAVAAILGDLSLSAGIEPIAGYGSKCPSCGEPCVGRCRCARSDSTCKNGHGWHECEVHHKLVLGQSDHAKSGCSCLPEEISLSAGLCDADEEPRFTYNPIKAEDVEAAKKDLKDGKLPKHSHEPRESAASGESIHIYITLESGQHVHPDELERLSVADGETVLRPLQLSAAHDVSKEKRDEAGKWTKGGESNAKTAVDLPSGSQPMASLQAEKDAKIRDWKEHHTESKAFRDWFGDSKVIDEDGSPAIVYHGTAAAFNTFDPSKGLSVTDKLGSWFAQNPELSNFRIEHRNSAEGMFGMGGESRGIPEGAVSVPVYLSIENPLKLKKRNDLESYLAKNITLTDKLLRHAKAYHGEGSFAQDAKTSDYDKYHTDARAKVRINSDAIDAVEQGWIDSDINAVVALCQMALSEYDGLQIKDDNGHGMAYVAFKPAQIKSAIANRGTFDPLQPNIGLSAHAAFDGSKHPRGQPANKGEFASKGGAATPPAPPAKEHDEPGDGDSVDIGDAAEKTYHYLHSNVAKGFAKLPTIVQTVVAKTLSVAFTAWTASQSLAEEIALEKGASPDEAVKMRSAFAAWDIAMFKPLAIATAPLGGVAAAATWIVPPVTGVYLAHSLVMHPLCTFRAARNLIQDAASDIGKTVKDHTVHLSAAADPKRALADALQKHGWSDWYTALLHAGILVTKDIGRAVASADAVFAKHPKDISTPQKDDADALFAGPDASLSQAWDESKHKRGQPGNAGEFGPGGGNAAAAEKPPQIAATAPAKEQTAPKVQTPTAPIPAVAPKPSFHRDKSGRCVAIDVTYSVTGGDLGTVLPGLSKEHVAAIAGALPGSKVDIEVMSNAVKVRVKHPDFVCNVSVFPESMHINWFEATNKNKGFGTDVFASQVEACKSNKFKQIDLDASRAKGADGTTDLNGYYTWARLGFDGQVHGRGKKISDYMKTPEGRAEWLKNGESFNGAFDLGEGSQSRTVFDAYRAEKQRTAKSGPANPDAGRRENPGPRLGAPGQQGGSQQAAADRAAADRAAAIAAKNSLPLLAKKLGVSAAQAAWGATKMAGRLGWTVPAIVAASIDPLLNQDSTIFRLWDAVWGQGEWDPKNDAPKPASLSAAHDVSGEKRDEAGRWTVGGTAKPKRGERAAALAAQAAALKVARIAAFHDIQAEAETVKERMDEHFAAICDADCAMSLGAMGDELEPLDDLPDRGIAEKILGLKEVEQAAKEGLKTKPIVLTPEQRNAKGESQAIAKEVEDLRAKIDAITRKRTFYREKINGLETKAAQNATPPEERVVLQAEATKLFNEWQAYIASTQTERESLSDQMRLKNARCEEIDAQIPEGIDEETHAANVPLFHAVIDNARAARAELREYIGLRKEMQAIKKGEAMDVQLSMAPTDDSTDYANLLDYFEDCERKAISLSAWDESKHKRGQPGNAGEFGPGGGGAGSTTHKHKPATHDSREDHRKTYVAAALNGLMKTSRTASGTVDTSANKGKAAQMTEGLTGDQAAQHAAKNFEKVIGGLFDQKDHDYSDPARVMTLVDNVNKEINKGITKEGVLLRTDDSDKYPYAKVADIPLARQQFAQEFAKRLSDPEADPIETAAWVEWRVNRDHVFADGCGKTQRALAALPLMRANLPLPNYDEAKHGMGPKQFFKLMPPTPPDPKKGPESYTDTPEYKKYLEYYRMKNPCYGTRAVRQIEEHYPPANPLGVDAFERHTNPDGSYTPERAALHLKIAANLRGNVPASTNKTYMMMGGGPASGKSSILKMGLAKLPDHHVMLDSDAIKAQLPEFQALKAAKDMRGADFVHEESSDLAKHLQKDSFAAGQDVVLDGTGDTGIDAIEKKSKAARAAGYKVQAEYCTCSTEEAVRRNIERAKIEGRLPPEDMLRAVHKNISRILPEAVKRGLFDSLRLWDTEHKTDGKPTLVMSAEGTKLNVHHPELWQSFLDKGK